MKEKCQKIQEKTQEKQTETDRNNEKRSYSERVRAKWFWCAFKLRFLQLICRAFNISKTCRHSKTRIDDDIKKDNKSHIFKHLHSTATCFDSYNSLCFKIIDKANSKLDLKIKEALHSNRRRPNLNAQPNHLALTLSLLPCCLCLFYFCVFWISISAIISTLIIGIFYCLNYTSLILHLFIAHLVTDFILTM